MFQLHRPLFCSLSSLSCLIKILTSKILVHSQSLKRQFFLHYIYSHTLTNGFTFFNCPQLSCMFASLTSTTEYGTAPNDTNIPLSLSLQYCMSSLSQTHLPGLSLFLVTTLHLVSKSQICVTFDPS